MLSLPSRLRTPAIAIAAVGTLIVVATAGSATAARLLNGSDIQNNSLESVDIKNESLGTQDIENKSLLLRDIDDNTIDLLRGRDGRDGQDGTDGTDGADATYSGPNWSIIDRNVEANGASYLRSGPGETPSGIGSLGIRTGGSTDRATFGNEIDFDGDLVSDLTQVGYSVYTTDENNEAGVNNMPTITFEIDPNLTSTERSYSSMIFNPLNSDGGAWTTIDAVTYDVPAWGLTGSDMPCSINGPRCTWTELQDALDDGGDAATISAVMIAKGRDWAFSGAVDDLTINDDVFDFEPLGVK